MCEHRCQIPRLIAFDLDYTLWPFYVDSYVYSPPFTKANGTVRDATNAVINHYREVPEVLDTIERRGIDIAIASRTEFPKGAQQLIELFGWNNYFKYTEIYPGRKTTHFEQFKRKSDIDYSEMLFFDDEERNIRDLKQIGVISVLVNPRTGLTMELLEYGLNMFKRVNG